MICPAVHAQTGGSCTLDRGHTGPHLSDTRLKWSTKACDCKPSVIVITPQAFGELQQAVASMGAEKVHYIIDLIKEGTL